ncbi:MAG: hypothetical protein AAFP07_19995, partial [Cyanobacteria bacterium J06606_4]
TTAFDTTAFDTSMIIRHDRWKLRLLNEIARWLNVVANNHRCIKSCSIKSCSIKSYLPKTLSEY